MPKTSVTRLGELSPFGRIFLPWAHFIQKNIAQMIGRNL
jgi:hypothetical protein